MYPIVSFISEYSILIIFGSILIGVGAIVIEAFKVRARKEKRTKAACNRARKREMTNTIRQKSRAAEARRKEKITRTQQKELIDFEVKELVDDEAETVRLFFQDK